MNVTQCIVYEDLVLGRVMIGWMGGYFMMGPLIGILLWYLLDSVKIFDNRGKIICVYLHACAAWMMFLEMMIQMGNCGKFNVWGFIALIVMNCVCGIIVGFPLSVVIWYVLMEAMLFLLRMMLCFSVSNDDVHDYKLCGFCDVVDEGEGREGYNRIGGGEKKSDCTVFTDYMVWSGCFCGPVGAIVGRIIVFIGIGM